MSRVLSKTAFLPWTTERYFYIWTYIWTIMSRVLKTVFLSWTTDCHFYIWTIISRASTWHFYIQTTVSRVLPRLPFCLGHLNVNLHKDNIWAMFLPDISTYWRYEPCLYHKTPFCLGQLNDISTHGRYWAVFLLGDKRVFFPWIIVDCLSKWSWKDGIVTSSNSQNISLLKSCP
jgi:hypothetical protein